MPNRASLMTGRMPTVHGLRYNGCKLMRNANTFVDVLVAAGLDTAAIGKCHLQEFTATPSWHEENISDDGRAFNEVRTTGHEKSREDPDHYQTDDTCRIDTPYFGCQHVDMITRHGATCGGHYEQWFRAQRSDWKELRDRTNQFPHNYSCPQANRTKIPEELYAAAWVADRAIDCLSNRSEDDAPFFTFVSFHDPHHPFNPPGRFWDMHSPDQFEVPLPCAAHQNPTPPMQWLESARGQNK